MEVVCLSLGHMLTCCVITTPTLSACFLGFEIPTFFNYLTISTAKLIINRMTSATVIKKGFKKKGLKNNKNIN